MNKQKKQNTEIVGPVRIESEVMKKIREKAKREDRSYSQQINRILKQYFERK